MTSWGYALKGVVVTILVGVGAVVFCSQILPAIVHFIFVLFTTNIGG